MTNLSFSRALASLSVLLLAGAMQAQTADENDASQPNATGNSKVRIVRLSQVKGEVQVDRHTGRGFEDAMANLPIVEKSELRTVEGIAEVEFEDNSTLRLAPNSLVEFPSLERLPTGKTASSVHLLRGTLYVSLLKSPGNQFTLQFGDRKIDLQPATHIRVQMEGNEAKLAVLDGALHVQGPTEVVEVSKKKTATFLVSSQEAPTVAKDVASTEFDEWDKQAAGYHSKMPSMSAFNNSSSSYAYGLNDMGYYGSFMNSGSCGNMWRPYFASASWDPFANGAWAYYPGAGYSWVSPYPWAWTPYHSGSWSYCAGTGWGWMPGSTWMGLNNVAVVTAPRNGPGGGVGLLPPVHGPRPGEPTLLPVNRGPLVHSGIASSESFQFRKDSAGMGVPRESLGRLDKFSREAEHRGVSNMHVYVNPPSAVYGRGGNPQAGAGQARAGQAGPGTIHRGSPAPGAMGPGQNGSMNGGSMGRTSGGMNNGGPAMGPPSGGPSQGGMPSGGPRPSPASPGRPR